MTVSAPPPPLTSDDFASGSLDPVWNVIGPAGIASSFGTSPTDAFLELVTPDGNYDAWNANNSARLMQTVADDDFTLETRFLTTPTERYQLQGILVEQDAQNWLRFDTYSDGNTLYAFGGITVNGASSMAFRVAIPENTAQYLQVTRQGDLWTLAYSQDGQTWTTAGSFTQALNVTAAGVLAGNTGNATGYTAQVDYVEFSSDPILDEDGTYEYVNVAPVATDDILPRNSDGPLTFAISDLLSNDSDSNGDLLDITSYTQPANGLIADNGDGTLTYTPSGLFDGSDTFTYTITDGELTDEATVTLRPIVDVWYGDTQSFGSPGEAQTWVNILGNVSDDVASLAYSLNGGPVSSLSIGADTRRLHNDGDFNVELAYTQLDGTSADDVVTLIANLSDGSTLTRDITIQYEDGLNWDGNYSIDWSNVNDIQQVAQIVDGRWALEDGGVRIVQPGYDRVLAIGDESWDNYEVRLSVTTHDLTNIDPSGRDGGGFAIGMLWTGHTDDSHTGLPTPCWMGARSCIFLHEQ